VQAAKAVLPSQQHQGGCWTIPFFERDVESFTRIWCPQRRLSSWSSRHRRQLTETRQGTLWRIHKEGAHGAVACLSSLLLGVPVLEPALRVFLFSLIAAVPWGLLRQILHLIKNYTIQTVGVQGMKSSLPQRLCRLEALRLRLQVSYGKAWGWVSRGGGVGGGAVGGNAAVARQRWRTAGQQQQQQ
jgi:hypothetical protein